VAHVRVGKEQLEPVPMLAAQDGGTITDTVLELYGRGLPALRWAPARRPRGPFGDRAAEGLPATVTGAPHPAPGSHPRKRGPCSALCGRA